MGPFGNYSPVAEAICSKLVAVLHGNVLIWGSVAASS